MKPESENWYGWQMLPGYGDRPYFSPIRISSVRELDNGQVWDVKFHNALYAAGVQMFQQRFRLLVNEAKYAIVRIEDQPDRSGVLSTMTTGWLSACCPSVLCEVEETSSEDSLPEKLDLLFGRH